MSKRRSGGVFVDRGLIRSPAYFALGGRAPQVLAVFLTKRRVEKSRRPTKRGQTYRIINNGEIVFTYREAKNEYRLTKNTFTRAIDQLVKVGFLDIESPGNGLQRDATLYALSERWRKYGTPDFEEGERPKGRQWQIPRERAPKAEIPRAAQKPHTPPHPIDKSRLTTPMVESIEGVRL